LIDGSGSVKVWFDQSPRDRNKNIVDLVREPRTGAIGILNSVFHAVDCGQVVVNIAQ